MSIRHTAFFRTTCFMFLNILVTVISSFGQVRDSYISFPETIIAKTADQGAVNPQGVISVDALSCNTSTFRISLTAGVNEKIEVKEVATLENGNLLVAGNILQNGPGPQGLLCILNNGGVLQSQVRISFNNSPTLIYGCKTRYDGSIYIAGTVTEGGINKIFICKLNNNLSTVWSTLTEISELPSKVSLEITRENEVVLGAQLSSNIFYAFVTPAGIIQWQRQVTPVGLDNLAGIWQNDFGHMGLVINSTRSGKKVTEVLSINRSNSSFNSIHSLGNGTEEFSIGKVTSYYSRGILTGVVKNNAGQYKLTRQRLFNSITGETVHTYDVPLPNGFDYSSAQDNAGDALGFCFPQQGKLLYIRHFSDYQSRPEYFRTYDVPVGSQIAGVTRSLVDGGYLFGLNTASGDSIVLLKTDSIGVLGGCGYTTLTSGFTENLAVPNSVSSLVATSISRVASSETFQLNNMVLQTSIACSELYCPPPPPDDTCLSTYYKTYRSNSHIDFAVRYYLMRNNQHITQNQRYDRLLEDGHRLTQGLRLYNERGDFIKGVSIFIDGKADPLLSKRMDDQHVMLVHRTQSSTDPTAIIFTFTLVNDNLDIVWSKSTQTFTNFFSGPLAFGELTKDAEGNYYYVYNSQGYFENAKLMVYKMDAAGNEAWLKVYALGAEVLSSSKIITTNTTVVVQLQGGTQGTVSVSLDKNTGQFIKGYRYPQNFGGVIDVSYLGHYNGLVYTVGKHEVNFQDFLRFGLLDHTGKPLKMRQISTAGAGAIDVKFGKLYTSFEYYNGMVYKKCIVRMDTTLVPDFMTEFYDQRDGRPRGMGVADNGAIYFGGMIYHGNVNSSYADSYIRKTDSAGGAGTCPTDPSPLTITDYPVTFSEITATPLNLSFTPFTIPVVFVPDTAGARVAQQLCSSTPLCNNMELSGPTAVCQLGQPFTYLAQRNAGCNLRPAWVYDTAFAALQTNTDTSAIFHFKKVGITKLYATINTGCRLYTDSIEVAIQQAPSSFSLGADTLLCPSDTLLLNAGTGFNSYLWQDGSTDSIFVVRGPGRYYVQTDNLCGNAYADTIDVSAVILPVLNIGPDATSCIQDTVHLQAQTGFATYNWFPANSVVGNSEQAFVIPMSNMDVWVSAITSEGCIVMDSISIATISAPPINLGRDTSFCLNDSIHLSAGNNHQQYLWSNGSTAGSIIVKQAGNYWVRATATNGCHVKDTMAVLEIYSLPKLNLGNDFTLCEGNQRQLNAGSFSSYLWQDGSTSPNFTISSPGTYHVTVIDDNQCSASDSIVLLQLLPSPVNFLPASDSICEFSTLSLSALSNYTNYQWSTGSTQKTITVSSPGNYVLTVTNNNGCSAKDTISVAQKNCFAEVFVPTAFTPNNDGLNDLFRPIVPGSVLNYSFEIYDRAGQRVFASTNPALGWRGDVSGVIQSSGVYVWHCRFQLPGKAPGYKKGTVTLIR